MREDRHPAADTVRLIGRSLRARRIASGITIADIAAEIGCGPSTIRRIEMGDPGTAAGTVVLYARAVGIENAILAAFESEKDPG